MLTPSGVTAAAYTEAINNGNAVHVRMTFTGQNIVLTDEDIDASSGLELTTYLNSDTDLTIGKAVMSEIRVGIFKSSKVQNIIWKDEFKLEFGVEINGTTRWVIIGYFTGVIPEQTMVVDVVNYTAHDRMSKFDTDAEPFLKRLNYPATLSSIYSQLCTYCGISKVDGNELPNIMNRSFQEAPVELSGYTCREVLAWIAEASGCYARIDNLGRCKLVWYTDCRDTYTLAADNIYGVDVFDMGLFDGINAKKWNDLTGFTWNELAIYTWNDLAGVSQFQIQGLRVKQTADDYGVTVPDQQTKNVYLIVDNPYLIIQQSSDVTNYVEPLYNRLHYFDSYIPMDVECVGNWLLETGDWISVEMPDGSINYLPVFCRTLKWNGSTTDRLEATGTFVREEVSSYNRQKLTIGGKLHEIYQDIDRTYERIQDQFGNYYTKTETASMVETEIADKMGNYYTKTETASYVSTQIASSLGNYYTRTETASYVTTEIASSLGNYYTRTETASYVSTQISSSLGNYYTKTQTASYVSTQISNSLGSYYTKTETASYVSSQISSSLGDYYSKTETASYVSTQISSSLGNYYTKTQTASYVSTQISSSLGSYYTKTETASYVSSQISSSLGDYSTTQQTNSLISAYVSDNAYEQVSGIEIKSTGIDISGSKYIKLAVNNSSAYWEYTNSGVVYGTSTWSMKIGQMTYGSSAPENSGIYFIHSDLGYNQIYMSCNYNNNKAAQVILGSKNATSGEFYPAGGSITLGKVGSPWADAYIGNIHGDGHVYVYPSSTGSFVQFANSGSNLIVDAYPSGDSYLGQSSKKWTYGYFVNLWWDTPLNNSSKKKKHNIRDIQEAGDILDRLAPVSFVYNEDRQGRTRFGLIWEEVVRVLPEICHEVDGEKGLNYMDLIPLMLREIQCLRGRVAKIERLA